MAIELSVLQAMRMSEFQTHLLRVVGGSPELSEPLSLKGRLSEHELENFVVANPQLSGEDLLVLGRQLSDFEEDGKTLDVLAVDRDGEVVLIELKVDDSFGV